MLAVLGLASLLGIAGYFAFSWGRIEYHAQRLGAEDEELATRSELALLELGGPGRDALYDFLIKGYNIKLALLSLGKQIEVATNKIVAISEAGEVKVAGASGPAKVVALLADRSVPAEKLCCPLAELARTGTVSALASVVAPGVRRAAIQIDLAFLHPGELKSYLTLRLGQDDVDLEGIKVALPAEVASFFKGKAAGSVRIIPRPGLRYARLLSFVHCLQAAGRCAVLVFGDAPASGAPSVAELEEISRTLASLGGEEQARAAVRLKSAMGRLFAWESEGAPEENKVAIENWPGWFENNKDYIYFDTVSGCYSYDAAASAAGLEHNRYWVRKLRIINGSSSDSLQRRRGGNR